MSDGGIGWDFFKTWTDSYVPPEEKTEEEWTVYATGKIVDLEPESISLVPDTCDAWVTTPGR